MEPQEADERYARLAANVAAARELLRRAGEGHWAAWMTAVHAELLSQDAHGLKRLLSAYGGMGSFNDLVIHPSNGHSIAEGEVDRVNHSLEELRSGMYVDARALLEDFQRAP